MDQILVAKFKGKKENRDMIITNGAVFPGRTFNSPGCVLMYDKSVGLLDIKLIGSSIA